MNHRIKFVGLVPALLHNIFDFGKGSFEKLGRKPHIDYNRLACRHIEFVMDTRFCSDLFGIDRRLAVNDMAMESVLNIRLAALGPRPVYERPVRLVVGKEEFAARVGVEITSAEPVADR